MKRWLAGWIALGMVLLLPSVAWANIRPVATPQAVTLNEDSQQTISLSAFDADNDSLTYKISSKPRKGTATSLTPDGSQINYTPKANFFGKDTLSFTVSDGKLTSKAVKVAITILPVNDAPVIPDLVVSSTQEDRAKTLTLRGMDIDRDKLSYVRQTQPSHGQVVIKGNNVTYTPTLNFFGTDSFMYTAFDGQAHSAPERVTITVTPVNDAPVALPQTVTIPAGVTSSISLQGSDPDGDALTYALAKSPKPQGVLGTVSGNQVTYTPKAGVNVDKFAVTVRDGKITSKTALVTVNVQAFTAITDPVLLRCFGNNAPSAASQFVLTTFSCDGVDLSVADLSQLARLPNLRTLDLSHTKLSNISGLAGLTQLTNLNLGFNSITNISALAGMTQLQTLNLSFNTISDISALSGMNDLQALYLDANNLTNISALSNKPALTKLYLDANQLASITPLASSPNLTELGLSHNQLSTITTLSGMSALQVLALDSNNLSTVSALSGLSRLQTLYLRGNLLSNVAAISGLTNLQVLELGFNTISTLPNLSSMTVLQHLGAEDNAITDVSALSGRTSLKSVALENNLITSNAANINGLKTLSALNTLIQLDHNRLLDVNGLTTLGGSNTLALTLADNCLGTVTLPSRITVLGRSWQFPAGNCAEAGVNNPPIAYDKTSVITQGATVTITLDATDPDAGDTLSYALVSTNVSNGTLNTSNAANGSVTFTASATHIGSAGSFTFRVTDSGGLQSAVATIALQISEPPPSVTNALLVQRCFGGSEPTETTLLALSTLSCTAGGSLAGADFADLSDVPNLTDLSLENAGLTNTDLAALAQALPQLTKLNLSGNQISDVSGLAGMAQLTTLLLDHNQLTDVGGLTTQNFPALIRLNLSGNTFDTADFTVLGINLPNLIMLFLDDSQLDNADLTALFGTATAPKLSSMYYLVLRNNSITSIEPLLHLAGVSTLLLDGNNIMDIAALSPIAPAAALQCLVWEA